jgi:hypothetical protein
MTPSRIFWGEHMADMFRQTQAIESGYLSIDSKTGRRLNRKADFTLSSNVEHARTAYERRRGHWVAASLGMLVDGRMIISCDGRQSLHNSAHYSIRLRYQSFNGSLPSSLISVTNTPVGGTI